MDPRLEAELKEMVLPLIGQTRDGALHGIGTTFVIGCSGRTAILLTAAHNVEAVEQLDAPRQRFHASTPPEFRPKRKVDVLLKTTRAYALYDREGRSHLCPVGQFWFLPELDIAICWTNLDGSDAPVDLTFRYPSVIIPANVAVEVALGRALREWVEVFCTEKEIGEFFTKGATYAHQLKVLSSVAADTLRINRLDPEIRSRLDLVRNYRNDFGHRGASDRPPITKDKAGELLTAAIFGYHYARYLQTAVKRLRRRRRG